MKMEPISDIPKKTKRPSGASGEPETIINLHCRATVCLKNPNPKGFFLPKERNRVLRKKKKNHMVKLATVRSQTDKYSKNSTRGGLGHLV